MTQHILIVGAGIVGLSTAYWLRKRGMTVTVVERGPVPCPLAASSDHHRLIRYPYGDETGYTARMAEAFSAWRTLWQDLRGEEARYYAPRGMLAVSRQQGDYTDKSRVVMEQLGIPFERIDGEEAILSRFPFLDRAGFSYAVMSEGGALMADRIIADLAEWLRAHGTTILERTPVQAVVPSEGRVTLADGRTLTADRVVIAAGVGTAKLMPDYAETLHPHRTVILYAVPPEDMQEAWAKAPCWTDLGGESDLWGMPPIDGLPLKLGNGALGRMQDTDTDRELTAADTKGILDGYRGVFRGIERFALRWGQANYWTESPENRFLLAEDGRALVVSACGGHGFKFGALSGRDVADALTGAAPVAEISARMAGRLS